MPHLGEGFPYQIFDRFGNKISKQRASAEGVSLMNWRNFSPMMLVKLAVTNMAIIVVVIVLIVMQCAIDEQNIWNWGWIILGLQIVYLSLSFKTVEPDQLAVILLFGNPLYEVHSGLVFVPWIVCSLRKESSLANQIQIPGEPEEIDRSGDDVKGVALNKILPIRATTGSYESVVKDPIFEKDPALVDKNDPLNQRMTLEPSAQIVFKIKDIIKFIRNIGSIATAKKRLRDTSEGVIQSEFAKRTPALVIAHRAEINKKIREEIGLLVKDNPDTPGHDEGWGVEIEVAQLLEIDISKKVNEALSLVTESKTLAKKIEIDAEANRLAKEKEGQGLKSYTISEGEGAANALQLRLFAEAAGKQKEGEALANARALILAAEANGLEKLAKIAKLPEGQVVLIIQQAREMYEKAKFSILPGDGGGLMGAAAAIQELLKRIQGEDQKEVVKTEKEGGK